MLNNPKPQPTEKTFLVRFGSSPITPKSRWRTQKATSAEAAFIACFQNTKKNTMKRLARRFPLFEAHTAPKNPKTTHPTGVPMVVTSFKLQLG